MNNIFHFFPALIIFLFLTGRETSFAQTMATGHITAEVIESISASSQAVSDLALDSSVANNIQSQMALMSTVTTSYSGAGSLFSGNTFTVNVVVTSESVADSQQNDYRIESSSCEPGLVTNSVPKSAPSVTINGTPDIIDSRLSGKSHGIYTVVFACN